MTLVFARAVRAAVEAAFERERGRIVENVPAAEVVHTGGTSLDGALTTGDLDIHVRVSPDDFAAALRELEQLYAPYRRDMWTNAFATFVRGDDVGVALTATGSEHDVRFRRAWRRLAEEPHLLAEYNALKRRHAGTADVAAYEAAKSEFFTRLATGDSAYASRP